MKEILKHLKEGISGAFATVENRKPDVRPWQFQFEEDGKFYFCTANTKDVYKQMKENSFVSFTATTNDYVTVRLSGEAIFVEDSDLKLNLATKIFEKQPGIKNIYKSVDNPIFEVFYIEHGEAVIADFSGQPPRKINF
ncbi:pyridoxamine 5'-phosphate oxidase [Clostridium polyendosporum]|uniref:Pyridoxamine 5'-phosphate oxidase n=1 Tax=Clostridium polyendosporum TaxID=69208 RepID=A0A919VN02_9CLOT|nr:pyridoxamine 5'-phosphate oxidase family protein [Clostridium polyendosporum]GIM30093.1 pyridoxamine 5'-phosphate oxidase [Clostridium polyendosporum]